MTQLIHARKRGIIAMAVVDILRTYSRAYFKDDEFGKHIIDLVIGCAVAIGQAENRLMTASDIAAYTGLSRITVLRHLDMLAQQGLVDKITQGRRKAIYNTRANHSDVVAHIVKLFDIAENVLSQLSKADSNPVAQEFDAR